MGSLLDSSQETSQGTVGAGSKRKPETADDAEGGSRKRRRRGVEDEDEEEEEHETPAPVKSKPKGKSARATDDAEEAAAVADKFLTVTTGRKRVTESERQFNDEFNKLQLARPAAAGLLTMPKVESHRLKWNERDLDAEELKQLDDWTSDISGKSLFRVKFVDFAKKPKVLPSVYVDEGEGRWAGMPNFKRFRPVRRPSPRTHPLAQSAGPTHRKRPRKHPLVAIVLPSRSS